MEEVCAHGLGCKKCTKRKLCNDGSCNLCLQRSFVSHFRSREWSERNVLMPRQVFKRTNKKYWFKCNTCSHGFEKIPNSVTRKVESWCPFCSGDKLCEEKCQTCWDKSFASFDKDKVQCWDNEKNTLKPREVSKNCNKKFWFNCRECCHSFEASPNHVSTHNSWCPYCSNVKLCEEECKICLGKSFASFDKDKVQRWELEKNTLKPSQVFKGSIKKFWFKCEECSHSFEASPNHISTHNSWCPYCGRKKLCSEDCYFCFKKSFASHYRAVFWSNKNSTSPREVFRNANKKYWFDCEKCKKEFSTTPTSITNQDSWCPFCCESKGEKKLGEELDGRGIDFTKEKKFKGLKVKRSLRYDFYFVIDGKKCVIEYDGIQHFEERFFRTKATSFEDHKRRDLLKTQFCYEKGISLLRIPYTHLKKVPEILEDFLDKVVCSDVSVFYFKNKKLYSEHCFLIK